VPSAGGTDHKREEREDEDSKVVKPMGDKEGINVPQTRETTEACSVSLEYLVTYLTS
jgi:hypothetical protein